MKKIFVVASVVYAALLVLCACSCSSHTAGNTAGSGGAESKTGSGYVPSQNKDEAQYMSSAIGDMEKVVMKTEYPEYPSDTKEIRLYISNQSDGEIGYEGYAFSLQKKVDGNWQDVAFKTDKNGQGPNFPAVAVVLDPKKTNEIVIELDTYFELPLEAGTYRIQKGEVAAEFEIK
ncbi:MAG: immunoglobulin-like domain-containing protein [Hydrogeniiclostridium sp.]